ncbi:MAG: hypothetical protein IVW53_07455 [Chloroflexi bacterium]|nr:hypothetical protein [Chloroflexota bacterium]
MWYHLYDRARELAAERERDDRRDRLARFARRPADPAAPRRSAAHSALRHSSARALLALGRSAARLAQALDADAGPSITSEPLERA